MVALLDTDVTFKVPTGGWACRQFTPTTLTISQLTRLLSPATAVAEDTMRFLDSAQCIYDALWMKPLDPFLRESSTDVAGAIIQYTYYTQALINAAQLSRWRFPEDVLLIRDEYVMASDVLQSWSRKHRGGVIVTGQPGIGK
jgi:hypothetical protein